MTALDVGAIEVAGPYYEDLEVGQQFDDARAVVLCFGVGQAPLGRLG